MPRFKRYEYDSMGARALERYNQDQPLMIAVDTETEGFAWEDVAFCVTISWAKDGIMRSCYLDLESDTNGHRTQVARQMMVRTPTWVFHNAKFDLQKLILMGVIDRTMFNAANIEDTNIIHALIDENSRHGLKYLAATLLGESTNEEKVLAKVRRKMKLKKDDGYHLLPREVVVPYAMRDTELTLKLYEYLRSRLPGDCQELYREELKTAIALLDIEANGIALDVPYLETTTSEYGVKLMRLESKLQMMGRDENGAKFNPNSPKQITEAFARKGLAVKSTDKYALAEIADQGANMPEASAFAEALLEHRKIKKLHGTYLTGMLAEQRGGIIHPNFNLTLPRTGRMSSSAATNN